MSQRRERRRARRQAGYVGIDALFGATEISPLTEAYVRPRAARTRALSGLVAISVFSAALGALTVSPWLLATTMTVQAATDYYDSLPSTLPEQPVPTRSVILAADGTRIAQFYSENRVPVSLEQVPQTMREAIVAIEDSRFYDHVGVDVRGTGRALINNLLGGSTQGGSTLTQQYVKNVLANAAESDEVRSEVTSRTSYLRKIREAKLALEVEQERSKDEILEGYLNIAYFGDGAYGVGTAAQRYFSKKVTDLTLAESALLAGLVQNPSGYDPTDNRAGGRGGGGGGGGGGGRGVRSGGR
jgi:membrane peptidoglycan carboxypeptidase